MLPSAGVCPPTGCDAELTAAMLGALPVFVGAGGLAVTAILAGPAEVGKGNLALDAHSACSDGTLSGIRLPVVAGISVYTVGVMKSMNIVLHLDSNLGPCDI